MKFFLTVFCLSASVVFAQPEASSLRGTVTDSNGKPVAEALVIITGTGASTRDVTTDAHGHYVAPYLLPGTYQLVVELRGYSAFTGEGIVLAPGEERQLDPKVVAGDPQDTPPVNMAAQPAPAESVALRNLVDLKLRWQDSPFVEKTPQPFSLMITTPGVQGNGRGVVISGL